MKLLLLQNIDITSARGANKANRVTLEQLHARGHQCRVISPVINSMALAPAATVVAGCSAGVLTSTLGGIEIDRVCEQTRGAIFRLPRTRAHLRQTLETFAPDIVMVAGEDPGQVLLNAALESYAPVAYIARSTSVTGVGPMAFFPNRYAAALLKRARVILANSDYTRRYLKRWADCDASVFDVNTYTLPSEDSANARAFDDDKKFVTMVNACGIKGIDIFLGLAARFPAVRFAAIPLWGTTDNDMARLAAMANVTILEPVSEIERILEKTRVLLFPSLWDEAFGRTVIEAMAFGIPVIASNVGGLPEAKLGVEYILPVEPINAYQRTLDEKGMPTFQCLDQPLDPWCAALSRLLEDKFTYEAVSARSRLAASRYIRGLDIADLEITLRRAITTERA